jgi:hypothetical protein
MFKLIYCSALVFVFASACNNAATDKGQQGSSDDKKTAAAPDSYSTDTVYQALPAMLADLKASANMQELLTQYWIMEEDKEALELASDDGDFEIPVRSFNISPDFTFTKNNRNAMEAGTWNFNEATKTLTFKYKDGGSDIYKLRALAATEMKLTNIGIKSETVLKFVSDGVAYKNKDDDPFYIANNKWRVAPRAPETDDAIKQRLKDNLHFFILFYRDAIARKVPKISFYGLPGCLKWYAGAIHIQNKKEINAKWKACFYNDAQALKAYDMMDKVIGMKYKWSKEKISWVKKNLQVLEQMYQNL